MTSPYQVVKDFEQAVGEYTGAPHVVSAMSCTAALLLAVAWCLDRTGGLKDRRYPAIVEIPRRTYVSVPMSIIHAGGIPTFRDEEWVGAYQLKPLPVWDCARRFTSGMYRAGEMQCVSFHWSKILGIQQGGAILLDDPEAAAWLRRARFDGRTEGVAVKDDTFDFVGWHYYLSPEIAAEGLQRIGLIPKHTADLKNDDYPDLSTLEIFR
jgi:dTDP-4-amino-4,6-dideoxygalactose transaminase